MYETSLRSEEEEIKSSNVTVIDNMQRSILVSVKMAPFQEI
jgi:hypothetical protein